MARDGLRRIVPGILTVRYLLMFLALKIHMSDDAYNALVAFPHFIAECRGDIPVKVRNATYF